MSMGTKQTLSYMEEWAKTASDRDIQFQMLRVSVETRDKIETIRGIIVFLFVLWVIGVVILVAAILSADGSGYG